jgi:hypothetical protein
VIAATLLALGPDGDVAGSADLREAAGPATATAAREQRPVPA